MRLLRVSGLPAMPLAAAAAFYETILPDLGEGEALLLVFPPADYSHRGWRLAAVGSLARELAPRRVNAIASADEAAIAAAAAYLAAAPGVTGQLLALDSHGAGAVIECAA